MKLSSLSLLIFSTLLDFIISQKYAYVSVLSSNDFLIPAKVLAYRLRKLNSSIPYIIIVTEDITTESIQDLETHGVTIHHDQKIDTPYIRTHKARKYQYTKIRLWNMTDYDTIVHLDLDVLPMRDISPLFECGSFCAVFRHSDMFNSGVFVLKTNETIFRDMEQRVQSAESYDGGDQGFLNTYFNELKYYPMYDQKRIEPDCYNDSMKRLSAKFNYDIGMYYLNNGRFLIDPDIIHYTMGPTKPWLWWTYPLFDLNWIWFDARLEMESGTNADFDVCVLLTITNFVLIAFLLAVKLITEQLVATPVRNTVGNMETHLVPHGIYLFSMYFASKLAYQSASPIAAWVFFSSNSAWTCTVLISIYTRIRTGVEVKCKSIIFCVFFTLLCHSLCWLILVQISVFFTRVLSALFFILAQQVLVVTYMRYALILKPCHQLHKYHILPNNHHCA